MAQVNEDDDMIVVIIGDEANVQKEPTSYPVPFAVKKEPLDEAAIAASDVDVILDRVTKHGEYIEIKQEKEEYDVEYLEDEFPFEMKVENLIKENADSDSENKGFIPKGYKEINGDKYHMRLRRRRSKIPEPHKENKTTIPKGKFFIEELRREHPKMGKKLSLLVEHLANIMKELKPPPPPPDYCRAFLENDVTTYECNICHLYTDSSGAAARHYQAKHGEKYLSCFACGVRYTCTTNLYKHEKNCKHKDASIVLRARGRYLGRKGKGRPFTTSDKFTAYEPKEPAAQLRYYCTKCPTSFRHKGNLEAHENSHEGRRPYQCDSCPAAYTSEVALRRHLQTHGENKYTCDDCGRKFKLKTLLISHINTHRPLRKHPCGYCPRRFAQKTALRHHQNKVHLNLPPAHACPVCPKRYARMSHVREHMKRKHGLSMITRKMFFKNLPTLTNVEVVKPAKIVFTSDTEPSQPIILNDQRTTDIEPKVTESEKPKLQNTKEKKKPRLLPEAKMNKQGQKTYEIVMDKAENADMMKELLEYIKLKKAGAKEPIESCEVEICSETIVGY